MKVEMDQIKDNFNAIKDQEKAISIVHEHIEICVDRRVHYEGYKNNPKDKIYYVMNKKDIEKYKASAKEINKFCKKISSYESIYY